MFLIKILICVVLYLVFKPYEYNDEEIAVFKEWAIVESQVISEMLEDFEFNGEPMDFPCEVENLPEELTINKIAPIAYVVDYDVEILLDYEGETIAMCNKSPGDDSIIYEFFTNDSCENAELFTIRGIGVGSTEEELINTFPNYDELNEDVINEDGTVTRVYCYFSEYGYEEQLAFQTTDGIVDTVIFSNH